MAEKRRRVRRTAWLIGGAALSLAFVTEAKCQLKRVVELPVTMDAMRPVLQVKINDRPASFIVDSGSFYGVISGPTAAQFGLKTYPAPPNFEFGGVGGRIDMEVTRVKELTLLNIPIKNIEFLVGGSEVGHDGILGQNLLENFDVEYDLSHGVIRLFKSDGCFKAGLAYWADKDQPESTMAIDQIDPLHPYTIGSGLLNGEHIRIMFDTGANLSVLSERAAARAGVKPQSPGVMDAGISRGIGRREIRSYVAVFDSFKVGDTEEIKHAKLRFADLGVVTADMLLGADFFLSHRVFVANREHHLFLTYNGGPVFNLAANPARVIAAGSAAGSAAESALPSADAGLSDPAELARRGSALAARHDYLPGLADLSKAIELAPGNPEFYYQRANVYRSSGDDAKALTDLNKVIDLQRDFLPAYVPRAEIFLGRRERALALADLDVVRGLAPKQADLRLNLAELYLRSERVSDAAAEFGTWIDNHPDDNRLPHARAGRCVSNMLLNQNLDAAIDDCNAALRRTDKSSELYGQLYTDRGLVRLRQGNYDKAASDFSAALKLAPNNARALYGRGVVLTRRGQKSEGDQAVAKARELNQPAVGWLRHFGIEP